MLILGKISEHLIIREPSRLPPVGGLGYAEGIAKGTGVTGVVTPRITKGLVYMGLADGKGPPLGGIGWHWVTLGPLRSYRCISVFNPFSL